MFIFPAIDLYDGKAVRLYKGDYAQMTVYSNNPLDVARDFEKSGAKHLHIVDLEGARDGTTPNIDIVCALKQNTSLFCEIGGGIRTMEIVDRYIKAGIDRVILGTAAVTDPDFAKEAAAKGCIIVLRLWNLGSDADNSKILDALHTSFPGEWRDLRGGSSQRLSTRIFLEWGERFAWPDPALPESDPDADLFCYGLRDQIGILVDGTVVPCCLDADANLALGNLFSSDLEQILASPRAKSIYDGFTRRRAVESLCRKCGYAKRFSR